MNQPIITPAFVIIAFTLLTLINIFNKKDFSKSFRDRQMKESGDDSSSFMRKLEKRTREKVKYSKRNKKEEEIRQAGLNLKYHQYHLLVIISSVFFSVFSYILIGNEFLSIEMIFLGRLVPMQIISFRKNKRIKKLEQQIGPFLNMSIKRYLNTKDFSKAIRLTKDEFIGIEPIYSELKLTVAEIEANIPVGEALHNMGDRCHNEFIKRYADFYKVATEIGTQDARENLLNQAYIQYEEDRVLKNELKKELSAPIRDAYILVVTIPVFGMFGFVAMEGYGDLLLNTMIGKILVASITAVIMTIVWFINNKIAAPLR